MVGAVIGDLAAWTWEHDKTWFYERLVSPEARLSGYGLLPVVMWPIINEGGTILKHRLYMICGKALMHSRADGVIIPDEWHRWATTDYDNAIPFELKVAMIIGAIVDSGFLPKERQSQVHWSSLFHGGKQEGYAMLMMRILRRLNEGATKDEAIYDIPSCVINYYPSGENHSWHDLLEYITFAWRCFYYSWDFTSALHNAAKCPANRHLAMILTGAFAEAMYGCLYSMTKKKFGGNYEAIQYPTNVVKQYGKILVKARAYDYDHRYFFKKNDALSNVEKHCWQDIDNPYSDWEIDEDKKKKLFRAYFTDWDNRYGVYLDEGWLYVYRSRCILLRFKLAALQDNTYRIVDMQMSNDDHANVEDLGEVLYSINYKDQ